jgi:hypothetical protein
MLDDAVQTAGAMKIRYPKKQLKEFIAASLIHWRIFIFIRCWGGTGRRNACGGAGD